MAGCACSLSGLCNWFMGIAALQILGTIITVIVSSTQPEQGECTGSCNSDANCTAATQYCDVGDKHCCPIPEGGGADVVSKITDNVGLVTTLFLIYIICKYRTHAGVKKYKKHFYGALLLMQFYLFLTSFLPLVLTGANLNFLRILRIGAIPVPLLIIRAAYNIKKEFAASDEGTYVLFGNPMLSQSLVAPVAVANEEEDEAAVVAT